MNILFISHRIPYPPNKGDKIRSYHILRYLARKHDIYLACLIDEPDDLNHLDALKDITKDIFYDTIHPLVKKLFSGFALLGTKPLSVFYFYSRKVQKDVEQLLANGNIDTVFCSSSPTAEFIFRSDHYKDKLKRVTWVMDLIDVDSHKWRQYAEKSKWPNRWVYQREAKYLQKYETKIVNEFDQIFLVSEPEKELLLQYVHADNVIAMPNGVDSEHFSPDYHTPLSKKGPVLVFTGAMDYPPNIEGVCWFVKHVWPQLHQTHPDATFYIIGNHPQQAIQRLATKPGVIVTGFVDDVRDYLAFADVCVIPLLIARGIQNKVLEAMAMGKPVLSTPQALEGINAVPDKDLLVAADEESFEQNINKLLTDPDKCMEIGKNARQCIENGYSWDKNLSPLDRLGDNCS